MRTLLGLLRYPAGLLRSLRGLVGALPGALRAQLLLSLAQCGHLRVELLDLAVNDLAYQHVRRTSIASSAEKIARSAASRSRSRCFGVIAAVSR